MSKIYVHHNFKILTQFSCTLNNSTESTRYSVMITYPIKLYANNSKASKGYSVLRFVLNKAVIVSATRKKLQL